MNCQFKYVTVLCVAIAVKVTSLKANMMKIDVFGSIILLTCMALVGSANAFGANTASAGGTGGNTFNKSCRTSEVLVGVGGRAGDFVDSIVLICAQIDRAGHWIQVIPHYYPVGSGNPFELRCPQDHAVSGFEGREGMFIDRLRIYCGPLGAEGKLVSVGNRLSGHAGGNGGSPFGPFHCVDGKPADRISGRAGQYLDYMYLGCNAPQPLRLISARFERGQPGLTSVGAGTHFTVTPSVTASGPVQIALRASDPAIAVSPAKVTLESGYTARSVSIRGAAAGCSLITASLLGDEYSAHIMVDAASTSALSLTLSDDRRIRSGPIIATLTLPAPAPTGGTSIALSSTHPLALRIPASVTIAAGSRSSTFDVTNTNFSVSTLPGFGLCVVLTATGNGATERRTVVLSPVDKRKL